MATKNVILIIVAAYCLMWAVTSRALGRDEEDEKMKLLWWMVGMFWPFVWAVCIIGLIAYLFGNEKKRKIKHF